MEHTRSDMERRLVTSSPEHKTFSILNQFPRREHAGAVYYELLKESCDSTAIVNDTEKLVYPNPQFTIDLILNSYRYGQQLQFKSYSERKPHRARRNDTLRNVYRLECGYLPVTHDTADKLEDIAHIIRLLSPIPRRTHAPSRIITPKTPLAELM